MPEGGPELSQPPVISEAIKALPQTLPQAIHPEGQKITLDAALRSGGLSELHTGLAKPSQTQEFKASSIAHDTLEGGSLHSRDSLGTSREAPSYTTNSEAALIPIPSIAERERAAIEQGFDFSGGDPEVLRKLLGEAHARGPLIYADIAKSARERTEMVDLMPATLNTTSWKEEERARLEFGFSLEPDSRDRARLVIQFLTSLPVEGWKNPEVNTKLKKAYEEYILHVYGVKDLEAQSPDEAQRMMGTQRKIIEATLLQRRPRTELTPAEQALVDELPKLSADFGELRGALSEVQREMTVEGKLDDLADQRLVDREQREIDAIKKQEAIRKEREQGAIPDFLQILKEEQRKKDADPSFEMRTYGVILEEIKEFEKAGGSRYKDLSRCQELLAMQQALVQAVVTDPTFQADLDDVNTRLAAQDIQQVKTDWDARNQERELYLIAAQGLGVTAGIEAQVEGYYRRCREKGAITRGDIEGFSEFVSDLEAKADPEEFVARTFDQKTLIRKLGLRNAVGVRAGAFQEMLVDTIKDYTGDAKLELEIQANRFAAAAKQDRPLVKLMEEADEGGRAGRFNPANLERQLRLEAVGQMRRRIIESRTYQSVGADVKDEDLPRFDRNDYNYLMFFATSESELQEALQDYVLYRASAEARWDVNEILQDITRIEQLLVGFKDRFRISPENFDRYMHETDGILKALVGDHFDHIGDEKTLVQVGNAFTDTYGAQRTERAYEGGEGMNAYILHQKENNPIYGVIAQVDGLQGELHNEHPSQRQLYGDAVADLAHRSLGGMLRAPHLNQDKLGQDVPKSEFLKLYWEDIYKDGALDLAGIKNKIDTGAQLNKQERWVCELLFIAGNQKWQEKIEEQSVSEADARRIIHLLNSSNDLVDSFINSLDINGLRATVKAKFHSPNPADRKRLTPQERENYELLRRLYGKDYAEGLVNNASDETDDLYKDEKHVLNYLIALQNKPTYEQKLQNNAVLKDEADDYEKMYWVGYIQQKIVKGDDLTAEEKQIKKWFYDPQFNRMRSQVQLALAFEGFMGEAALRSSATFMADNGDFVPDEGIYDYMHVVRHLLEQKHLNGKDYSNVKQMIDILKENREEFEEVWDRALEGIARYGFSAKMDWSSFGIYADAVGNPVFENTGTPYILSYEKARKHPGKLWTMDTYLFTEQITRDALVSDQNYAEAMGRRFMLPQVDASGNRVEVDNVEDGAYILPRNLWMLDPQGKILDPTKRADRAASWFEEEVSKMVDYSSRKHFWITRRVMRKMGKRPPETRQGQYTGIKSADHHFSFTLDHRGRYVVESGKVHHALKFPLKDDGSLNMVGNQSVVIKHEDKDVSGVVLDRQFTGYLVEANSESNANRVVLKDNEAQIPSMEDRVRIGDENISAGLARKRLTKISQYVTVKNSRWARFRELAATLPSMILPDHRVHGGLDMRSGIAVIKTENQKQRDAQNKRMDYLIQGGNQFAALALQGQFYRRYMDGPGVEGEWYDPFSAKPTRNGEQAAKIHHHRDDIISKEEAALEWRDNVRERMKNFETGGAELFYRQQAIARSGMGSSLARMMQDAHVIDAFQVLMTQGVDRDYKPQKDYWEFLFAKAHDPVGYVMDSAIGQMTRGVTNEIIDGVAIPRYFKKTIVRPYLFEHDTHKYRAGAYQIMDELF